MIARHVKASGVDAARVAEELANGLRGDGLALVVAFADWRIDSSVFAAALQRALPAPVVGCTTTAVLAAGEGATAAAIGLYGNWVRAGIGVAPELPKAALVHSRDAVRNAAAALGTTPEKLDPKQHVAITLVDGSCGHEESFCIGSAAAAPQIRVVGGSASTEVPSNRRSFVWANGEALADAGIVVLLESKLPFQAVTSSHLVATDVKTVVTAADGRAIHELDGRPAVERFRELVAQLGVTLDVSRAPQYSFARFVDGMPYVRSMTSFDGTHIRLASAVGVGHVLRLMRPTNLIAVTKTDLEEAARNVGGTMSALFAFSCLGRHWEAAARGIERELEAVYSRYPTIGFQSSGEHTGMLLVNHTLTALAIGTQRG